MIRSKLPSILACLLCLIVLIAITWPNSNRIPGNENVAGIPHRFATSQENRLRTSSRLRALIFDRIGNAAPESSQLEEGNDRTYATNAVPNELIVKLKPDGNIDAIGTSVGAQVKGRMDKIGVYRLEFADADSAAAARQQLDANNSVESIDSNYSIGRLPAAEEISGNPSVSSKLAVTPGDSDGKLVIGLIDTAVQVESSGLNEAFFLPTVSVAGESGSNADTLTHGTSMAEALLEGLSSVNANPGETTVRILSVDVYGNSESTTTYQVAEGIVKAIENGATIINLSLGSDGDSSVLQQVISDAHAQGIIFFGAAGNEPVTIATYPAAYSEVVAVTATDSEGNIASYANHGEFVDIATPGTVLVTFNGKSYLVTGTSASTALASGAAAGIAEQTGASPAKVEETVRKGLAIP